MGWVRAWEKLRTESLASVCDLAIRESNERYAREFQAIREVVDREHSLFERGLARRSMHISTMLLVATSLASSACAPPPPMQAARPTSPDDEPESSEPRKASAMPEDELAPVKRVETVEENKAVAGVHVTTSPVANVAWEVTVENVSDDSMSIVWDESSFVGGNGHSWGRLLRGETRKMDSANPQPPAPLAPHSKLTQTVIPDGMLDTFALSAFSVSEAMNGGHLYLVLQTPAGRQTWNGSVSEGPDNKTKK